jgi:predicted TIM-barrel enzyme
MRATIRQQCEARIAQGEPVILGGTGVGLIAQAAVAAGIDILMAYNIGAFRMNGHGSMVGYLPYGDANAIVLDMAHQIVPVAGDVPVVAGIAAGDPYRDMPRLLDQVLAAGYAGITNTPTSGVYDGVFRQAIEKQGFGYAREVELARLCHERDIFSVMYAFTPDEARQMAAAGADMVATHLGLTGPGGDAAFDDAITRTREMCEAARAARADVLVVAHGGPLENAATVGRVFAETPVDGYIGGSSIERTPVAAAVRTAVEAFRSLRLGDRR